MKTEISAGGVVVRKYGVGWQVLLLRDMNRSWTFPKGLIETGEQPKTAAAREIAEETGLQNVEYVQKLGTISYTYKRNGLIHKTVHYFVFRAVARHKLVPQRAEGIHAVRWMSFPAAFTCIGYEETNSPLLERTQKILQAHGAGKRS